MIRVLPQAFGAAESISDRYSIHLGAKNFTQLAPLDLVINDSGDNGCGGGDVGSAYNFAQSNGASSPFLVFPFVCVRVCVCCWLCFW